jgi:formamidopyrimidine-DNA glycosylase
MPELPEVETVRRGLAPAMEGALIERAENRRPDLRFPFPDDFATRLSGTRILALRRRAKYLLADLASGETLIMHLGMSGSFRIEDEPPVAGAAFHHPRGKSAAHDHVVLALSGGKAIIYNDPRRFGFMTLAATDRLDEHPLLAGLGVEPTGNALSAAILAGGMSGRKSPMKAVLLDQKLIAGLGNIYVCEALWRAHISPRRLARTLVKRNGEPTPRLEALTEAIRAVIADAIAAGGSSLRDYVQADGELGYFQHAFAAYDREGEPCRHEGCAGTIRRIVQSGRSTFYCPRCQK